MSDIANGVITPALLRDLNVLCPDGITTNVELNKISRWKIGGLADLIIRPKSLSEVIALREYFYKNCIPYTVIGLTTNLLFSDTGLKVPCLQISSQMSRVKIDQNTGIAEAQAGAWVPGLARKLQQKGLTGAEHLCGIPGTVGGLICMNGGSQRKSISTAIVKITSIGKTGEIIVRTADECQFEYRDSIYQRNGEIIVSATLKYAKSNSVSNVRTEMLSILRDRRNKFPQKQPNCGSVFKSNPMMYEKIGAPGLAIERLGFKGYTSGSAQVSKSHANFIINAGDATSKDVLGIIKKIKAEILLKTGFNLEVEAKLVKPDGEISEIK